MQSRDCQVLRLCGTYLQVCVQQKVQLLVIHEQSMNHISLYKILIAHMHANLAVTTCGYTVITQNCLVSTLFVVLDKMCVEPSSPRVGSKCTVIQLAT